MTFVHSSRATYRFGRFELDVRSRELRKDGIRLRLQDQPFEVLSMLLERPGEVLTRDELRQRLWPEGTFVDFEHGLNAAVKRLRGAIGDDADNPRFVETLHRRGYRFVGAVEPLFDGAVDAVNGRLASQKLRLAVLPLAYLSDMADSADRADRNAHEYFAEGLREEMITQLGRMCADRLGVIARTSSSLIQRQTTRIRDIGRALRVDFVVEGSVRREGDRVRVSAQLVETRGETQLWAESYERHLSDCFLVQSEVATKIVHALAVELLPDERIAREAGTRHVDAHQAYLKGRYHWNKATPTGLPEATAYFEQAIALDPAFSAAHAALARAHLAAAEHYVGEPRTSLEAARCAAGRALAIDPSDSEALLTVAEVDKILAWDWEGAERSYRTALAFNPSNVAVHRHYGLFLAARGRNAEAAGEADRACDLDPLCLTVNTSAAWVRFLAREYERAVDQCRHTLDMDASFVFARRLLAASLAQLGQCREATIEIDALMSGPLDAVSLAWLAHALAVIGDRERAGGVLDQLNDLARTRRISPYHRALAHTATGDVDGAISFLARACDERDPAMINVGVEPRFEPLGADPRFQSLVGRLKLAN
jgi:TolB-like protein/DNA-binding winged helix-turn-helix (wHTH) protein/Tfp pilus assembly protein PilF